MAARTFHTVFTLGKMFAKRRLVEVVELLSTSLLLILAGRLLSLADVSVGWSLLLCSARWRHAKIVSVLLLLLLHKSINKFF